MNQQSGIVGLVLRCEDDLAVVLVALFGGTLYEEIEWTFVGAGRAYPVVYECQEGGTNIIIHRIDIIIFFLRQPPRKVGDLKLLKQADDTGALQAFDVADVVE